MSDEPKLGPTGEFPDGKLDATDQGQLAMRISSDDKLIRIDFGKPTAWFALPKQQGVDLAILMLRHAGVDVQVRHQMTAQGGSECPPNNLPPA